MTCSDQSISPFPIAWVKDCCAQEEGINRKRKNAAARNLSAHTLFLIFSSLMPEEIQIRLKIVQKRQKIGRFLVPRFQKHHKSHRIVKVKQKAPLRWKEHQNNIIMGIMQKTGLPPFPLFSAFPARKPPAPSANYR
jgi:hypothetical protein